MSNVAPLRNGTRPDTPRSSIEEHRALAALKANTAENFKQKTELAQLNRWFDIALNNMVCGLSVFDSERRLVVSNKTYREIYDLPKRLTKPGTPLADLVRHHVKKETGRDGPKEIEKQRRWIEHHVSKFAHGKTFSHTQHLKNGRIVLVTVQPLMDGGWVDIQEDVTEKRLSEQKIRWLARHDPLTKISNRLDFREALERAFHDPLAVGGFALHRIDLDRFKEINDRIGHTAGDAILKSIAKRLLKAVRKNDIVARISGDEFAILQTGRVEPNSAEKLATRILQVAVEPHCVLGQSVFCGVSIGIALAPEHGRNGEELLKSADLALDGAKTAGRGCLALFDVKQLRDGAIRHQLEADLQAAVAGKQLELHYQPIVDFRHRTVAGFEALMRWQHPTLGKIAPADFIPVAEQSGLIIEMGRWALYQACSDAALWPKPTRVAVNLSPVQFEREDLYHDVLGALDQSGLAPQQLELEITETVLLRDEAKTHEVLHNLRALGVRIALDDFGTGYASLSYLRSFPFDEIKIDRSFVRDLDSAKRNECIAIITAVSGLARQMKMGTVAEGVETLDQAETVSAAGCDELQGFYFGRPVPANEINRTLLLCRAKFKNSVKANRSAGDALRAIDVIGHAREKL